MLESVVELVDRQATLLHEVDEGARATEPERVAIGTPSSGLKPIEVSMAFPSSTAVTEHPLPRCETTRRPACTCSATDWTASPWKPYRRTPQRPRARLGADGLRGRVLVDGPRFFAVDEMPLEARRACVDG